MNIKTTPGYDAEAGATLRALRLSYTVKQTDLAERLGVPRVVVTRWEQGTRGLTVDMLLRDCRYLCVPASRLLPQQHQERAVRAQPAYTHTPSLSLEENAITSIARVLRERPERIFAVLQIVEQRTWLTDAPSTV